MNANNFWARESNLTETMPRDVPRGRYDNLGATFAGPQAALLKIWEGKKVQNSARFRTTLDFDREYLWNGL